MYKSCYSGKPPLSKMTVEKNYRSWLRFNYAIAVKQAPLLNNFQCLLRSPFFWKCLYIQDLIDMEDRKNVWEKKLEALEKKEYEDPWDTVKKSSEFREQGSCAEKMLHTISSRMTLPMPRWAALRILFDTKFLYKVKGKQENWVEKKLNAKLLKKAEALYRRIWGTEDYHSNLSSLYHEFLSIKSGLFYFML